MHHDKDNSEQAGDALTGRAEEILCDVLEIESEVERKAFLLDACAGDPDLSALLCQLLQAQDDANRLFNAIRPTSVSLSEIAQTILEESAEERGGVPSIPDDDEVGKQIGNYRLLKKIGEGGGGSVYLAEQEKPMRRRVALKILKLGMDTKSVIARFEAERQVLAMMGHPNIAHVLNAGATDTGRPFFVMELVNGMPVTTHCEKTGIGIRQRLELFIQICHAIHHAHQKGIIHRDVKPSNILVTKVDGITVPKVIDFGIAKATGEQMLSDGTFYTSVESFVGTPAYMSPEQADLAVEDIDVRSDIYSLGVLLYELLTGKPPFDQKQLIRSGLEAMRRTIRECEPPRPSVMLAGLSAKELAGTSESRRISPQRLISQLEGDLDWIVMKALEKDRERRYGSAEAMADDIRRYLEHEPVLARPPSRTYRLGKLVRRNKAAFAAGAAIAAVLLISTGVSSWLLIEQRIAENHALRAEVEKGTIQKEFQLTVESHKKVAKALVLYQQKEYEQADAMLDGMKLVPISPGNTAMFRRLGDLHALNGRWAKAKERFDVLMKINEFEGKDSTMDDHRCATLLAEQGYLEEYNAFRELLISRYSGTESPKIARRVLRLCLLAPASSEMMNALAPYASITERSYNQVQQEDWMKQWESFSLAQWTYRIGDYEQSVQWCELSDPDHDSLMISVKRISVRLIEASALYQLEQVDAARALLDEVHRKMNILSSSSPLDNEVFVGFWWDQAHLRVLLREAESTIGSEAVRAD